jgi:MscS family membrane protein
MKRFFLILISTLLFFPLLASGGEQPGLQPIADSITTEITADTVQHKNLIRESGVTGQLTIGERLNRPDIGRVISIQKIFWAVVVLMLAWLVIKFLISVTAAFGERRPSRRIAVKRMIPVIRIVGWTFVVYIIIVGVFQPPIETIIAFFASIGVAIGFASQDLLKNIFGGLVILFDRPFHVGDKIEVGKYYGEVIEIGLRSTRIVTADDSVVAVPNGEMMNHSISNSNSGESNCQVVAEFFLPLGTDLDKARSIALEAAQVSKYIYLNKPVVVVFFHEVNGPRTYVKMRLKAYVSDIRDEFVFKSDMSELVIREFLKEGILEEGW